VSHTPAAKNASWRRWLLAFCCLAVFGRAQNTDSLFGKQLKEISIRNSTGELSAAEQQRILGVLPVRVGDTLTRTNLRESLQALYPTRRFSEIAAEVHPSGDGVALVFATNPNFFVGSLSIEGAPRPPSESQLLNATKLELGQLFAESELPGAIERITAVMADNGYYESQVTPRIAYDEQRFLAQVTFNVERGQHARIGKIEVNGEAGYSAAKILDIAKMHSGDEVTAARVSRALRRLRARYQDDDRLEAQVSIKEGAYHGESDTLDYVFTINRGPKVDVIVEGANIRRGLLKKYVPIFEESAIDDDLLNEGRRNLRDYLQTRGYFDAQVEFELRRNQEDGRSTIVFDVNRGERHKFVKLDFAGNKYFDEFTLRERMRIEPASLLLFYGRFSQALLARDIGAIQNLYRQNGFQQVLVQPTIEDDYRGEHGDMRVLLTITEGPQTRVNKLTIEGNKALPTDAILNEITNSEGQPYSDINVATDRDAITYFYFNRGFPDMRFESLVTPLPEKPDAVDVKYVITEGEQRFVNDVLVAGTVATKPFVVDRELRLSGGDPLSQSGLLETQSNLYNLGIFNEVNVAVQNPQGSLAAKNVIVNLEEGARYTFSYGLGLEVQTGDLGDACENLPNPSACQPQGRTGVSPRVSFDVTRSNFLGRNHTVVFKSRIGRLQQRALISYEAPHFFSSEDVRLTFTTLFDKTQDVRTFTAERLEGTAQIQQILNRAVTLFYGLTYRRIQVDPTTLQVDPNLIPLFSQPVRVGFPSFNYVRDTRDDPIQSTKGAYTSGALSVAAGIFGSESSFVRLFVQNSTYHRVFGGKTRRREWVFARSTRIGVEGPFGSPSNSFVPLPERFFVGGGNSHRGYAINQAGPRDLETGFPLGGEALFLNNFELRSPPIALPFLGENLSTAFFHDAGNVFASAGDMITGLGRFRQKNPLTCQQSAVCDFRFVSQAVGFGLRYKTPIGPVRLDLGYSLTPTAYPIRNQARSEELRRLNIFFSIGQTF
jgi:outer membrane protein insertion porin family